MILDETKNIVSKINFEQLKNALDSIDVTDFGINIDGKFMHPSNVEKLNFFCEFPSITDFKLTQYLKQFASIYVTEFGIWIEAIGVDIKQPMPNDFREFPSRTDVNWLEPLKQWFPNDVTEFGMSIDFKELANWKQLVPNDVTVFPIVTDNTDEVFAVPP